MPGLEGLENDPVTNEIVASLSDPSEIIGGITGFFETVSDVIGGIERMAGAAVSVGVGAIVSLQELTENPELQAGPPIVRPIGG